jgi:hypothetical protein
MIKKVSLSDLKDKDGKSMKIPKDFNKTMIHHFTKYETDREALSIAFESLEEANLAFTWVNPLDLRTANPSAQSASTNELPTSIQGGGSSKRTKKNKNEC